MLGARTHPSLQSRQRYRGHTHALEAHRHQRRRDRLAIRHEHVQLARGWLGVDALGQRDHAIGGVAHRRYDHNYPLSSLDGGSDAAADPPDACGGTDRGTAVLLDDHRVLNIPLSVTRLTSPRPCCGAAEAIAFAIRAAIAGGQNAKTLGPAPQMAAP